MVSVKCIIRIHFSRINFIFFMKGVDFKTIRKDTGALRFIFVLNFHVCNSLVRDKILSEQPS